jgi:lipopolysaccharide transport system ATP-binding protein
MKADLLTLDKVAVSFRFRSGLFRTGTYPALKEISFSVKEGESLGIIGRNGAGKTTLLRLLAGVFKPDSGSLIRHRRIKVSLLSLQLGFDRQLTGRDNAILSGLLLGFSRRSILSHLDEIISFSELGDFIDLPVKTYSSGMSARLGFSVALKMSPDILLIDEVLGVGDNNFRDKSATAMREKIKSNQTVILVSHSSSEIKNLCDRAVWIEKGITKMVGDSASVVDTYLRFMRTLQAQSAPTV